MDIRRLEIFLKLMETRSFSKTAQELDLTQPTVSGHVKTLEEQIGLQLFDRHRRKVRPTAAANVLYTYAKQIMDLHLEAGFALERFRGRISGRLRLGGSTIPGGYILPGLIGRFHTIYAESYMTLIMDGTSRIIKRVADGDLEMGMVGALEEREDLIFDPVVDDQMVLIAPKDQPKADPVQGFRLEDLVKVPFIIREEGSGTRTTMLKALSLHSVNLEDLHLVAEMGGTESVRQAVRSGLGFSIVSRVAIRDYVRSGLVREVPVLGLDLGRRFFLVSHRHRPKSPLCNAFLDYCRMEGRRSAEAM